MLHFIDRVDGNNIIYQAIESKAPLSFHADHHTVCSFSFIWNDCIDCIVWVLGSLLAKNHGRAGTEQPFPLST